MRKYFLLFILICLIAPAGQGRGDPGGKIRRPVVAGRFYPSNPHELGSLVHTYIGNLEKAAIDGRIVALISPHAGYVFSGQVAAHAYKLVEGMEFDDVIVIAPSHRVDFLGASIYDGEGYETPLGIVPIDGELSRGITEGSKIIEFIPQAHAREHSLEVQIPFLQSILKAFRLVPMVMGPSWNLEVCRHLSQAIIKSLEGRRTLIIASSDLTHSNNYQKVVEQDERLVRHIEGFDITGLEEDLRKRRCQACGGGPILVTMMTGRKRPGDYVVGYMAAVFYQGAEKTGEGLTKKDKRLLHGIARRAIEDVARGKPLPESTVESGALMEKRGAFVTLKKRGRLRGCIGYMKGIKPLCQTIKEMAVAAAFHDPRFRPVTETELPDLEIEISVLTPLKRIKDVEEIEVGKHGIFIEKGFHSGLLLPQVATEYGWDRETFLEHCCLKAGLSSDAWKDGKTRICTFSAEVF
jgi:AmmeMemoRadiSam system protein B/AmmeMemoRadiSam system protein A